MKKIIKSVLVLFVAALMLGAQSGCDLEQQTSTNPKTKGVQDLEAQAGVQGVVVGASHFVEAKQTEVIQQGLMSANPIPDLSRSLERENLIKRLELLNDQNKIFYVYLVSYGNVMAYYTAQGKISSVNSKLTTQEQIVANSRCLGSSYQGSRTNCYMTVESPDLDGSYGTNGDGIFFFTTEGAYVEWAGEYMISDHALRLSTPPRLIAEVNLSK